MSAMDNLRLPASESAKVGRARTHEPLHTHADVVRAAAAEQDVAAATSRRRQRAHHLSGFARA